MRGQPVAPWLRVALTSAIVGGLVLATLASGSAQIHQLTFEERVKAQEAIEKVYYSHQVGATRPFGEAVPRALLEQKVRTYLKQSVALEKLWKTPATEAALQRELERIAANTRLPERLEQIYDALKRDRSLGLECFARPLLVDRLTRSFFAFDQRIHAAARLEAETLRYRLVSGALAVHAEHPNRRVLDLVRRERSGFLEEDSPSAATAIGRSKPGRRRFELEPDEFERWRALAPKRVGEIGPVVEERDAFVVSVALEVTTDGARLAVYTVPKTGYEAWWEEVADDFDERSVPAVAAHRQQLPAPTRMSGWRSGPDVKWSIGLRETDSASPTCIPDDTWDNGILDDLPLPRYGHTAVWTGNLMIVWGGLGVTGIQNTGARYDPLTDTWAATSTTNAPAARYGHTAVWTSTVMVVWGGLGQAGSFPNTGGRYDTLRDLWEATSQLGAPDGRSAHSAIWTGTRMIVWGGDRGGPLLNSGGGYDPASDVWVATSVVGAPAPRAGHTVVWTGSAMIVWGGFAAGGAVNTGGRYDPAADSWTPTSTTAAPEGRAVHTAVWEGGRMIVWGGRGSFTDLNTGGRYDPIADTWAAMSTTAAPSQRNSHTAVWTGSDMIVWGGLLSEIDFGEALGTGARYDPVSDSWAPTSMTNAPSARARHTAVWTGSQMIVWGGHHDVGGTGRADTIFNTGGRYDVASDTWTPTSVFGAPTSRVAHTAVWTGNLMIVWGGTDVFPVGNGGGRYDLMTDSWTPTSTTAAPAQRFDHTAVWTGSEMIVWGGQVEADPDFLTNDGARYNPISETWSAVSMSGAPSPRSVHTAVWTGSLMIVWGGVPSATTLNTGGRYDPVSDSWTATSTTGAPSPRSDHTAAWTGSEMIVWGGYTCCPSQVFHNSGGRYDPLADSWRPVSLSGAPIARDRHSAIWTGSLMIVWGGRTSGPAYLNTGGRYDPMADGWTATSTVNAPSGRYSHEAVWTGSKMIIWGGAAGGGNTGGLYEPAADIWTPTSTTNAPSFQTSLHTAVWTGGFMIVWARNWGGRYALGQVVDNDGDGYNCAGDCDETNPQVWSPPVDVSNLDVLPETPTKVTWSSQASLVGPGTWYDLASGLLLPSGGVDFASCICLQSSTATAYTDTRPDPGPGSGLWYLVRARNSCGPGTYGTSLRDTTIPPCP